MSDRIDFQLISAAGLDDDRDVVYSHGRFLRLAHAIDRASFGGSLNTPAIQLRPRQLLRARDDEHDFAFRRMCLIVCKQFGSSAATEFFKFLCQLTCDAQLALRDNDTASAEAF